jgi:hypothetical protein
MNIAIFFKFLWNSPTQSRIRCSIYQNKFTRQDGESMTSHYFRHANLAANLQPAMSEEDLTGDLTSHYPIAIQRSLISGHVKTTPYVINLLGKPDALEERWVQETRAKLRPPRREPTSVQLVGRYDKNRSDSISMYNMRMAPPITGSEHTVLRIDATEEGATNLA